MDIALSNKDILKALNNKTKVIQYKDLLDYKDIDDLLYPHDNVVILYNTNKNYGHWTCIIKRNNDIEMFDSYGYKPDDQQKYITEKVKLDNNMNFPYLTYLLYKSKNKYKVHYNNYKLQSEKNGINTCGRWVILRIHLKNMNINEFAKIIKNDKIAYNLTSEIGEKNGGTLHDDCLDDNPYTEEKNPKKYWKHVDYCEPLYEGKSVGKYKFSKKEY